MECFKKIGDKLVAKKKYNTQDEAIIDAKIINNKISQIHKVVPYRCTICYKFHLGTNKTIIDHDKNIYKNK
jgi:hypothetical protein